MDFWNFFWLIVIFAPLIMLWTFALFDIFRRNDMSGAAKALWILVVFLVPYFGSLIYLLFRSADVGGAERHRAA